MIQILADGYELVARMTDQLAEISLSSHYGLQFAFNKGEIVDLPKVISPLCAAIPIIWSK